MWSALGALAMKHSALACRLYNQLLFVQFHACCHGSSRPKNTGWISTPAAFAELQANAKTIIIMHLEGQLGKMDAGPLTRLQRQHPTLLAQRAAACLVKVALTRGLSLQKQPRLHDKSTAAIGHQSRKHAALIPEYHHVKSLPTTATLPKGAKIIAPHFSGEVREECDKSDESDGSTSDTFTHRVGFFHTPEQFLR